jgi:hypothetical protein
VYELLILVSPETTTNLAALEATVRSEFSSLTPPQPVRTSIKNDRLTVDVQGFRFHVDFSCESHILEESQELAAQFAANHPARAAIARARCRLELTSDDDPDMDHFNDMIFICQAAEALGQVFIFDPQAGGFQ